MGIVIAARELGKMESNEVFCRAVEEEEGGEKLVEIIKVWITIEEELKAGEVIVGKPPSFIDKFLNNKGNLEEDFNVIDQPDDLTLVRLSSAITAISTARRSM
ncbi:hypothetical protein L249_1944 [Ophiocordyceps polyrhachis-furcata BCC 54312]|uniref:Uncharacterized protein n=1 Tax=Ophiocordyceps polyrhachis-furcata BCC 54312 TaxID=1330021 RepID=A0A367LRG4_9HYPO|nr:hypothetical protein L249_1944 [Ophiocordyceps polyrhachis-furcata BCC 54312]